MKLKKKIIIIGAGPGGLTAGMILSHRGFEVTIYEKDKKVGGRNQAIELDGFKFDTGPTFLMMKFLLDEVFKESGRDIDDYLRTAPLDPMYRLQFEDKKIDLFWDKQRLKKELKEKIDMPESVYDHFLKKEGQRFKHMYPCLQKSYHRLTNYLDVDLLRAIPYVSFGKSMFDELGNYVPKEEDRMAFSFQSKYLGMSPWECPAAFMIIPFVEHQFGIYHVEGGLSEISEAMSKVIEENGGKIHLKTPVKHLLFEDKKVIGIELENGEIDHADETIINADFAYAMEKLTNGKAKKYSPEKLKKKKYSCSTFMLYLGLDKVYDLEHHTILFSKDYKDYVTKIFKDFELTEDLSIYVRNASINDPTLAPEGKSALYILVPAPNNKSGLDWDNIKDEWRDRVLDIMEDRLKMKGLRESIEVEKIITPKDWEVNYNVYLGATFNLAHSLDQMLYLRPRNKFEAFGNCYLVGGGTHPGSGLPTIYESARISSNLISDKYGLEYETFNKKIKL